MIEDAALTGPNQALSSLASPTTGITVKTRTDSHTGMSPVRTTASDEASHQRTTAKRRADKEVISSPKCLGIQIPIACS